MVRRGMIYTVMSVLRPSPLTRPARVQLTWSPYSTETDRHVYPLWADPARPQQGQTPQPSQPTARPDTTAQPAHS
ncbi:hypothetical protein RRG08_044938 [Elysia crispata]|uniref:Uncharacterized protein n=1 Tax=Elysia crispata TaxID=231223 RepID=A0AAE1DLV4_9GAST|nr:hypothetical protein RRG08_044938 [Elysia crispata]